MLCSAIDADAAAAGQSTRDNATSVGEGRLMVGRSRRALGMVGLALAVALVAAACGGGKKEAGGGQKAAVQRGGVFRTALDDFGFTGAFDPTGEYVGIAFNSYHALLRTLMSTRHIVGTEGNKLYPDLATAAPTISSDGLTYTFKLKQGVKFGPPVSRAITSKDVEYAFERINSAALVAQYGFYYCGVIKGMDCKASRPQAVSGIETPDDATIVFHLSQPTGDFLYRLTMPATAPIPQEVAKCFGKAGDYGRFLIASGPYMIKGSDRLDISSCGAMKPISGFDPTRKLLMVRNPNFDQATDQLLANNLDGIQIVVDTNVNDIFNKVQSGTLDASYVNQPPKSILAQYLTDPAKKQFLRSSPDDQTWYITMNLAEPPFDDLHVRKAVSLVVDKAAISQAWGGAVFGKIATHVMPPTMLNNQLDQSYDPYATPGFHGDLAKAQDEMKQSRYDSNKDGTCDAPQCRSLVIVSRNVTPFTDMEPVVISSLAKIGIRATPRELATGAGYTTIQTVKNRIPIALNPSWIKDYADAYTFAAPLFGSASINPSGNVNYSMVGLTPARAGELGISYPRGAAIPSVDADVTACEKVPATDPNRTTCWANLDKKLMEQVVPWVPYLWSNNITILSPSVTKFEFDQSSAYISLTQIAVSNKVDPASLS
jgi:peptide/nickel transport system substrate-binding protein